MSHALFRHCQIVDALGHKGDGRRGNFGQKERKGVKRMTPEDLAEIDILFKKGETIRRLSRRYEYSESAIRRNLRERYIRRGEQWGAK